MYRVIMIILPYSLHEWALTQNKCYLEICQFVFQMSNNFQLLEESHAVLISFFYFPKKALSKFTDIFDIPSKKC